MTKGEAEKILNEFSDDPKEPKWYLPEEYLRRLKIVLEQYVKPHKDQFNKISN